MQSLKDLVDLRTYCNGKNIAIERCIPPFKIVEEYIRTVYPDTMTKEAMLSVARELQTKVGIWRQKTFFPVQNKRWSLKKMRDFDDAEKSRGKKKMYLVDIFYSCGGVSSGLVRLVLSDVRITPRQEERRKRRADKKKRREAGRIRVLQKVTIGKKERWRKNKY